MRLSSESHLSRDMTKPTKWLCAQRRLRSAWASAQSDQSLRCRMKKAWVLSYQLSAQRRLWSSDWADAHFKLGPTFPTILIFLFLFTFFSGYPYFFLSKALKSIHGTRMPTFIIKLKLWPGIISYNILIRLINAYKLFLLIFRLWFHFRFIFISSPEPKAHKVSL